MTREAPSTIDRFAFLAERTKYIRALRRAGYAWEEMPAHLNLESGDQVRQIHEQFDREGWHLAEPVSFPMSQEAFRRCHADRPHPARTGHLRHPVCRRVSRDVRRLPLGCQITRRPPGSRIRGPVSPETRSAAMLTPHVHVKVRVDGYRRPDARTQTALEHCLCGAWRCYFKITHDDGTDTEGFGAWSEMP